MVHVEPLTAAHAQALEPQPHQSDLAPEERVALILANAAAGAACAILAPDGTVLCVGGVITDESWPHRAIGWTVLSAHAGPFMRAVTRAVRDWLAQRPERRVEFYVDAQFPQGVRWAHLLGFTLETPLPMRHFLPNGNGAYMFGRVR